MTKEVYDVELYWRRQYIDAMADWASEVNRLQDLILAKENENRRLKRENFNLRKTKERRR